MFGLEREEEPRLRCSRKLHYSATRILRKPYIHTQTIEGRELAYGKTNEIGQKEVLFSINRSRTTRAREARHMI